MTTQSSPDPSNGRPALAQLQELRTAIDHLAVGVSGLRDEVTEETQVRRMKLRWIQAWLVGITFALILLCVLAVSNFQIIRNTDSTNAQILSCTTTEGDCYRRNQTNLTKLVDGLVARLGEAQSKPDADKRAYLTAIVKCADAHDGDPAVDACIQASYPPR